MDTNLLLIKAIVVGMVVTGFLFFVFWRVMHSTIEKDVGRLNKETEAVRAKQGELNEKIKQANEELNKRKSEADILVAKMSEDATNKAKEEREKIIAKARQEAEELITKAQNTKDDIRKAIAKEMDMKAVDVTAIILNEIFSEKAKGALNECLIGEFIENLTKVDMEMIAEEITTADIVTSAPLSESLRNRLSDILLKKLNRPITVNPNVDEKILSGVILRFGSLCLDGSLANMIKETALVTKEKIDRGAL